MPESETIRRPSPDALLVEAQREDKTRGKLKVFLGAAPGVGKTYEMLLSAKAKLAENVDVVVGVVETHGRAETKSLLKGFEVIPRARIDYHGHVLHEMDLDALLKRRPQIALVDELAHTNAPGSRHPKRYLDVEELLSAGIDVYSTLNIQHVESLNDVVAQITRIRVRETVPDLVLNKADDIEVIHLSPEELIQRLKEGKVYVPKPGFQQPLEDRRQRHRPALASVAAVNVVIDDYNGTKVEDPYRWLEDAKSPATRAWIGEENAYTQKYLDQITTLPQIAAQLTSLMRVDQYSTPILRAGKYFFKKRLADENRDRSTLRVGWRVKISASSMPANSAPTRTPPPIWSASRRTATCSSTKFAKVAPTRARCTSSMCVPAPICLTSCPPPATRASA